MKSTIKLSALALIAAVSMSSTAFAKNNTKAATPELSIDSKVEVAYNCQIQENGKKRSQPITVMYGVKNGEAIVAQAKVNNEISTGLFRVADPLLNRFVSESAEQTMWTAMPAKAADLRKVDGGKLSVKRGNVHAVIAESCKLDQAATAKLK